MMTKKNSISAATMNSGLPKIPSGFSCGACFAASSANRVYVIGGSYRHEPRGDAPRPDTVSTIGTLILG
jgi:hypothetical protein